MTLSGGTELGLELVVSGGVGAVSQYTAILDRLHIQGRPDEFDTGIRPGASISAGPRLRVGDHFALRLELADLVFSNTLHRVDGCSAADLGEMDRALRAGGEVSSVSVSQGCRAERFASDEVMVPLALSMARFHQSSLMHVLSMQLTASVMF